LEETSAASSRCYSDASSSRASARATTPGRISRGFTQKAAVKLHVSLTRSLSPSYYTFIYLDLLSLSLSLFLSFSILKYTELNQEEWNDPNLRVMGYVLDGSCLDELTEVFHRRRVILTCA
jgi:hypothetical protein